MKLNSSNTRFELTQQIIASVLFCLMFALDEPITTAVFIACSGLLVFRLVLIHQGSALLSVLSRASSKNIGALGMTVVILLSVRHSGLINAMVNLLLAGSALWWFTLPATINSQIPRQFFIMHKLCLCLFFLISVGFIYEQTLLYSLLFFVLILITWLALFICENPEQPISNTFRFLIKYTLVCVPLAALIFLLLPNLAPFWKLPKQEQTVSGLSESMTPGDIAELAQSTRLAFRVAFDDNNPSQQQLYWRVMTMPNFNGKTWAIAGLPKRSRNAQQSNSSLYIADDLSSDNDVSPSKINYSVIAEPTHQPWLFSLANSHSNTDKVNHNHDDTLSYATKLTTKLKYEAQTGQLALASVLGAEQAVKVSTRPITLTDRQKKKNLYLPPNLHANTAELSHRWMSIAKQTTSDKQQQSQLFIKSIANYFRQNGFIYTLTPPKLTGDHIDNFLFDTQQGFCAHYASATAVMLRQQGIPTRVVAGYQGGEYNPNGNYFNVYDSSAHAWVEFWVQQADNSNSGHWYRFDPTATIAPNRILQGLGGSEVINNNVNVEPMEMVKSVAWLNTLRQQIQSLDYYWTIWVLDFDPTREENRITSWLQSTDMRHILYVFITLIVIIAGAVWMTIRPRGQINEITQVLTKLEQRLTKYDRQHNPKKSFTPRVLTRQSQQTLADYQAHLLQYFPELAEPLNAIFSNIDAYLYQPQASDKNVFIKIVFRQISELS
ncbi:DUF3488 and transglutaminase-like domain-containing protein [Psychrosphaera sp. B3R10]|uniref:transglutaminase family protein n=1 Tax=unclassified Psychrosphaera TaxID=2641570 RepID=UPI001C08B727|nr:MULTISPECIES: DUF3488 and transglutaminase-like domain-containing protein [unclassified Psychrosphaera]MBU2883760.1 DUF3488 and transglutaminase-like domain-containing protein [Psychrosphaera sp. I2R16]MBU2987938.1 DUF3488 and transglutaminase-like domain-containing protein [Psychrosphaera sp. B3R10]